MIKELLNSTGHVVTERIKNPFIGSFILAWFYLNWELAILLVNLPEDADYKTKVDLIKVYLLENLYDVLLFPLLYSMIILISYGVISNITLIITSFFQKTLRPKILNLFDKNLIIEKRVYNDLKETYSKLLIDFDTLQQSYYGISKEREELKAQLLKDTEKELEKIKAANENLLKEANLEREKIIEEAKLVAKTEAEKLITQAQEAITKEADEAMDTLEKESIKKGLGPINRLGRNKK